MRPTGADRRFSCQTCGPVLNARRYDRFMVLRWERGAPSDAHEWIDALYDALGDEESYYWVRFYREPGGWRFDLERHGESPGPNEWSSYRRADESAALRVFTTLIERGKPLDPGWSQSAASPSVDVVRMPRPAQGAHSWIGFPAPNPEPLLSIAVPSGTEVGIPETALETLPLRDTTTTEPVSAVLPVPNPNLEPPPRSFSARPASHRFTGWRRLQVPDWRLRLPSWRGLRLPAWPSVRLPAWREPRLPSWQSLRLRAWRGLGLPAWRNLRLAAWRRMHLPAWRSLPLPDWRSHRLVLAYAPAIVLFAWWLSRGGPPRSPASPPAPAALSQVAQTRLEQPVAIPLSGNSERPSPGLNPKAPTPARVTQPRRVELVDVNAPGVTPPVLVSRTRRSPYPPLALARGVSGTVWLNALVDETGRVSEIALVGTSAPGLGFEDAAMTQVHSRLYRPATKGGVPVRVRLPIKVEFEIAEAGRRAAGEGPSR